MERTVELLQGPRFHPESNMVYKVPIERLPKRANYKSDEGQLVKAIDFTDPQTMKVLVGFIKHHQEHQVPRLKELHRYYECKNNIKFRPTKPDKHRADNKIASDFVRFITTFKRGVVVGNPIKYSGSKMIMKLLDEFNQRANESYHNQLMVQDMVLYGRAYELPYRDFMARETITKLDVIQTFVVYDTSADRNSICGIHYYKVRYLDDVKSIVEVYGNDGFIYTFECKEDDFDQMEQVGYPRNTYVQAVAINEWSNNEERQGDSDAALDDIDAYDLAQSELANFMQDSSDAYLVIVGNPDTGKGKNPMDTLEKMRKARMLVLGDKKNYGEGVYGAEPNAFYLKKEYDSTGAEAYKDRLVADILRFSFVVDFTDETLGSNQTGVGMRFKGWGNDNDRTTKENVIRKAIMRRLRLLASSWAIKESVMDQKNLLQRIKEAISFKTDQQKMYDLVNEVSIKFVPNIPRSDEELVTNAKQLYGLVSDQTLLEMLEAITGVNAEEEIKRLQTESETQNSDPRRPDQEKEDKDENAEESET